MRIKFLAVRVAYELRVANVAHGEGGTEEGARAGEDAGGCGGDGKGGRVGCAVWRFDIAAGDGDLGRFEERVAGGEERRGLLGSDEVGYVYEEGIDGEDLGGVIMG